MPDKFQNKYRIPSARWQDWDYGWDGSYSVTICTKNRRPFFGKISDGEMHLSGAGIIADVCWHEIKNHAKNIELGEFQVMPNHLHGIIIIDGNDRERHPVETRHAVETGHALSLPDSIDNPHPVETGHALSLPPKPKPNSSLQSPLPISVVSIGRARCRNQGQNTLSSIIGSYKSAVTKHVNRLRLKHAWQPRFHDHVIRDERAFENISAYIRNNPVNWEKDEFFPGSP